jgi:hypothetical protein
MPLKYNRLLSTRFKYQSPCLRLPEMNRGKPSCIVFRFHIIVYPYVSDRGETGQVVSHLPF